MTQKVVAPVKLPRCAQEVFGFNIQHTHLVSFMRLSLISSALRGKFQKVFNKKPGA
jgi:hypothetical protein